MTNVVNCGAISYCMCYGVGCSACIHNPLSNDPNPVNVFLSFKCGSQATMCARCHDFDACYDCDPYDPLVRFSVVLFLLTEVKKMAKGMYSFIAYPESADIAVICDGITAMGGDWEYILHDKDTDDQGQTKTSLAHSCRL